jgi:predicted acyl esterase
MFWDRYLKDTPNEVDTWPSVRYDVRTNLESHVRKTTSIWPPQIATHAPFYITDHGLSRNAAEQVNSSSYIAHHKSSKVCLDFTFTERTEITGYISAKLWVQAIGNLDSDVIIALSKIDEQDKEVFFWNASQQPEAPAAMGWLRVSHRELDPEKSFPGRPYHKHERRQWVRSIDIVPIEVEIWPSSTAWEAGQKLRMTIQGTQFVNDERPTQAKGPMHSWGEVKVWYGGEYDSHLYLPIVEGLAGYGS